MIMNLRTAGNVEIGPGYFVAFTGRMAKERKEMERIARMCEMCVLAYVGHTVELLVVSDRGWPNVAPGSPRQSSKIKNAIAYGTAMISEREFLNWVRHKYTPPAAPRDPNAAISQLVALRSDYACGI